MFNVSQAKKDDNEHVLWSRTDRTFFVHGERLAFTGMNGPPYLESSSSVSIDVETGAG